MVFKKTNNYLKYFFLRYILKITTPKDLISYALRKFGSRVMYIDQDQSYTLNDINSKVNKTCQCFLSMGIKKGDTIAVLFSKNRVEFIEIRLAAYKCGFIFCSLLDEFTFDQTLEVLSTSHSRLFIFDKPYTNNELSKLHEQTTLSHSIPLDIQKKCCFCSQNTFNNLINGYDDTEPKISIKSQEISAIGFTSGTTAKSKGVIWSHHAWLHSFYHLLLNNDSSSSKHMVFLHVMPFSTSGSLSILPTLVAGAQNILIPFFEPELVARLIHQKLITALFLAPSFLIELWEYYIQNKGKYSFKSLQKITVGSAPLPSSKLIQMIDTFGPILYQSYGMAEVLAPLAALKIKDYHTQQSLLSSVGQPIRQVTIKLKDIDSKNTGLLLIKSKTMSLGYFSNGTIDKTYHQHGWFTSSDYGRFDTKNYLYIIDRASSIITCRNQQIFPREIEEIIHAFDGVKEVVVGVVDQKLTAVISCLNGHSLNIDSLKLHCQRMLDPNKIPDTFKIVKSLPHSTSGKILRHIILDQP